MGNNTIINKRQTKLIEKFDEWIIKELEPIDFKFTKESIEFIKKWLKFLLVQNASFDFKINQKNYDAISTYIIDDFKWCLKEDYVDELLYKIEELVKKNNKNVNTKIIAGLNGFQVKLFNLIESIAYKTQFIKMYSEYKILENLEHDKVENQAKINDTIKKVIDIINKDLAKSKKTKQTLLEDFDDKIYEIYLDVK